MLRRRALSRIRGGHHVDLREVSLLTAQTRSLHNRAVSALVDWLATDGIETPLDRLLECPLLLDLILEAFGAASFNTGAPMYSYLRALSGIQALQPQLRKSLPLAWKLFRLGARSNRRSIAGHFLPCSIRHW